MARHLSKYNFSLKTEVIDGELITYKVIESPNNTYSYFTIDENNELVYIKGKYTSEKFVQRALAKYFLIAKKIKENNHFFKDSKKVTICGITYLVKTINSTSNKFEIINKTIFLHLTNVNRQYGIFQKACEFIAHKYMDKRISYWAKKMNAKVTKIIFKDIDSKFAYYTYPSGKVTFSFFVLAFDLDTIDYLIIHELSHYFHQNHSSLFWNKVAEFCPNYKNYEKTLKFQH